MILADTSAWVEYDRETGSAVDRRIDELIRGGGPLAVTEPVIMEVVAGARSAAREDELRRLLASFPLLPFDQGVDFDGAAHIYRMCRTVGVTPRGMVDCMVASVAKRHGATILAHDIDLARVSAVLDLELDQASLRP